MKNFINSAQNSRATVNQIASSLNLPSADRTTYSRAMKRIGIKRIKSIKKTKISNQVKRTRINYCNYYLEQFNLNNQIFNQHCFTDESIFTNQILLPFHRATELNYYDVLNYSSATTNLFKINVYGMLSPYQFKFVLLDLNHDKKKFRELLIDHQMLNYMNSRVANQLYLVQDNSSVHEFDDEYPRTIRDECESRDIVLVNFPKYSPDLNILENLWGRLKVALSDSLMRNQVFSEQQLFERVERLASEIVDQNYLNSLFDSLPERHREVIRLNGNITKY